MYIDSSGGDAAEPDRGLRHDPALAPTPAHAEAPRIGASEGLRFLAAPVTARHFRLPALRGKTPD